MKLEQKRYELRNPYLSISSKLLGDPDKIISEFRQGNSIKTIRIIDPEQVKLASEEFTVEEIEDNNATYILDMYIK